MPNNQFDPSKITQVLEQWQSICRILEELMKAYHRTFHDTAALQINTLYPHLDKLFGQLRDMEETRYQIEELMIELHRASITMHHLDLDDCLLSLAKSLKDDKHASGGDDAPPQVSSCEEHKPDPTPEPIQVPNGKLAGGTIFCPRCGAIVESSAGFCHYCGSSVAAAQSREERSGFCFNCGSPLKSSALFCPVCGCRQESSPQAPAASCDRPMPSAPPRPQASMPTPPVQASIPAPPAQAAPADPSQVEISKVYFSAVAPKRLTKGDYSIIDILMYEESCRQVVDELIAEAEDPVQEKKSGLYKVEMNSDVRIVLTSPDIEIEDNEESATWYGDHLHFSFAVSLPEDYKKRQVLFTATVYINGLIASRLKFVAKCLSLREQKLHITREDVLSAFVSYASQDRNRVAVLVQGMKKARPDMDIFFDVDSLRSGEDWEAALTAEIDRRDILYLCWSHFASQSKWVETEWRYAFDKKGLEYIDPIAIDPPDACPPPEELKQKHFNDKLLYIINAK